MYSGLAFGAFGAAILTGSPVRTVVAVLLAALLNFKAASEEEYLSDMHGEEMYRQYATKVDMSYSATYTLNCSPKP